MDAEDLQYQIEELQEDVKRLTKMNNVLSGEIFKLRQGIDVLLSRLNECESSVSFLLSK